MTSLLPSSSTTNISDLITILITTSPSPLHPSCHHIEKVMESIKIYAPSLANCRKLIMCDGCLIREKSKPRSGRVTQELYDRYLQYKLMLAQNELFMEENYEMIELKERQGFGFAVRHAMFHHVQTPMVFVVQHDRTLMRHVNMSDIVNVMEQRPKEIGYVLLPFKSTDAYAEQWSTKLGQCGFKGEASNIRQYEITMTDATDRCIHQTTETKNQTKNQTHTQTQTQQHLLPCLRWYDSTHLAYSDFYRNVVFSNDLKLVVRGGFIEDKLGQAQRTYYMDLGIEASIQFWKMWLYQDDRPYVAKMVAHLDGSSGGYSTPEMLKAKLKREAHIFDNDSSDGTQKEQQQNETNDRKTSTGTEKNMNTDTETDLVSKLEKL